MTMKGYLHLQNTPQKAFPKYAHITLAFTSIALLFGCSSRSITKPRSEIVEEARDRGIRLPSLQEEKRLFFADEANGKRRLKRLVSERTQRGDYTSNYRIGAGDSIEVNVFDIEELNTIARVRESGFISLPLVGAVRALGYTEGELQSVLRERLTKFVRSPEVHIAISDYDSQKVSILGAVNEPGVYALKKGKNSIVEVLGLAGGLSERSGSYINFVPSTDSAQRVAKRNQAGHIELSLNEVLGTNGELPVQIPIYPGDTLIIPEAGQVMVEGEVEKRGAYDLASRTTLLGALASAGGITYGAKVDEVEVIRNKGSLKRRLVLNLEDILSGRQRDVPLRNGDIVRVPSDSGRRMRQDTYEGITRLINFGVGGTVNVAN